MRRVNISALRMVICPFYANEGILQIIAYGIAEAQGPRRVAGGAVRKLELQFSDGEEVRPGMDIRRFLVDLLIGNIMKHYEAVRDRGDEFSWSPEEDRRIQQERERIEEQLRAQLCGVKDGRVVFDLDGSIAAGKWEPTQVRTDAPGLGVAACINDVPGTLHAILKALAGVEDAAPVFIFNIDYFRTIPSVEGPYEEFSIQEIEIFGRYSYNTRHLGSTEPVNGMVVYGTGGDSDVKELGDRLNMEKVLGRNEYKQIPRQMVRNIGSFRRRGEGGDPDDRRYPYVPNCPISRGVGCPRIRQRPNRMVAGPAVRIIASILDVPGALKSLLEIIGVPRDKSG